MNTVQWKHKGEAIDTDVAREEFRNVFKYGMDEDQVNHQFELVCRRMRQGASLDRIAYEVVGGRFRSRIALNSTSEKDDESAVRNLIHRDEVSVDALRVYKLLIPLWDEATRDALKAMIRYGFSAEVVTAK